MIIDATSSVDYTTSRVLPVSGSAADVVARVAIGALVVKALHLFAGASWPFTSEPQQAPVVAICAAAAALKLATALIADLGGRRSLSKAW